MTHTNTTRELENFGSLHAELLEIDITSLDRAGEEDNVGPTHLDSVEGFTAHRSGRTSNGVDGEFQYGWNETSNVLNVHNTTSGSAAANNAAVNDTKVTWWGRR